MKKYSILRGIQLVYVLTTIQRTTVVGILDNSSVDAPSVDQTTPIFLGDSNREPKSIPRSPSRTYLKVIESVLERWQNPSGPNSLMTRSDLSCSPLALLSPYFTSILNKGTWHCRIDTTDDALSGLFVSPSILSNIFRIDAESSTPIYFPKRRPQKLSMGHVSKGISDGFSKALINGKKKMEYMDQQEKDLVKHGIMVSDISTSEYGHLQFFKTTQEALRLGKDALLALDVLKALLNRVVISPREDFELRSLDLMTSPLRRVCPASISCTSRDIKFRRVDGACNNLRVPKAGRSLTAFQRLTSPNYGNDIDSPRVSTGGGPLPSPRLVSSRVVKDSNRPRSDLTLSVMQWGQFIDHDIAHSPIFRFDNETGISCCSPDGGSPLPDALQHPECFPISIPASDRVFGPLGRRCMNFVRTIPVQQEDCRLQPREQMNQLTHFLDGSMIYGSTVAENSLIRAPFGGLLRMQKGKLLPIHPDAHQRCKSDNVFLGRNCFMAGDFRVNIQPDLAVVHTLWIRQHNRIARTLSNLNPSWNHERLYQMSRKIVVAQLQHIVYNEWLPVIIGSEFAASNGLLPLLGKRFANVYDPTVNPSIFNEFATVAFRFGHSLVQGMVRRFNEAGDLMNSMELSDHFGRGDSLYNPHIFDSLCRGLTKQPIQTADRFVTKQLTNKLFKSKSSGVGLDLISLNLQRARDHGIPPYNVLRRRCRLRAARNFKDLKNILPGKTVSFLRSLYSSVDDIDPFIGGISESPARGAVVGPTFRCIIAEQFKVLKKGDRFYYENAGQQGFTLNQLLELKKSSWARLVCDNSNRIDKIQPLALRVPGPLNEKVDCSSMAIPKLNLNVFKN